MREVNGGREASRNVSCEPSGDFYGTATNARNVISIPGVQSFFFAPFYAFLLFLARWTFTDPNNITSGRKFLLTCSVYPDTPVIHDDVTLIPDVLNSFFFCPLLLLFCICSTHLTFTSQSRNIIQQWKPT